MKKIMVLFVLICLSISLVACESSVATSAPVTEGNQEEFLKDMAAGINKRLSTNRDTTNLSREQVNDLYNKVVQYELDNIEKYQNVVFPDKKFNDLAHTYIEACLIQKRACRYYKNDALYYGLWENARIIRSTVITELYMSYDLPISAETASSYGSNFTSEVIGNGNAMETNDSNMDNLDHSKAISYRVISKDRVEFGFLEHTYFEKYLTNGVFRCGTDFEPGRYFIISIYQADSDYNPSVDPDEFTSNGNRIISVKDLKENDYIKVSQGQVMVSKELVDDSNWKEYGMLTVGEDLMPGDYRIELISNEYHTDLAYLVGIGGSIQIFEDSPADKNIKYKTCYGSEQNYISLAEGQSIIGLNIRLEKVS